MQHPIRVLHFREAKLVYSENFFMTSTTFLYIRYWIRTQVVLFMLSPYCFSAKKLGKMKVFLLVQLHFGIGL